jgi:hypothetical protein
MHLSATMAENPESYWHCRSLARVTMVLSRSNDAFGRIFETAIVQ